MGTGQATTAGQPNGPPGVASTHLASPAGVDQRAVARPATVRSPWTRLVAPSRDASPNADCQRQREGRVAGPVGEHLGPPSASCRGRPGTCEAHRLRPAKAVTASPSPAACRAGRCPQLSGRVPLVSVAPDAPVVSSAEQQARRRPWRGAARGSREGAGAHQFDHVANRRQRLVMMLGVVERWTETSHPGGCVRRAGRPTPRAKVRRRRGNRARRPGFRRS